MFAEERRGGSRRARLGGAGAPFGDDPGAAEAAILGAFQKRIRAQLPSELQPPPWPGRRGRQLSRVIASPPR